MIEQLLLYISGIHVKDYFIVTDMVKEGETIPDDIEHFLNEKRQLIESGISGRKFKYQNNGWILFFTFYPTTQGVDEKYALKNKVIKLLNRS